MCGCKLSHIWLVLIADSGVRNILEGLYTYGATQTESAGKQTKHQPLPPMPDDDDDNNKDGGECDEAKENE